MYCYYSESLWVFGTKYTSFYHIKKPIFTQKNITNYQLTKTIKQTYKKNKNKQTYTHRCIHTDK